MVGKEGRSRWLQGLLNKIQFLPCLMISSRYLIVVRAHAVLYSIEMVSVWLVQYRLLSRSLLIILQSAPEYASDLAIYTQPGCHIEYMLY